MLSNVSLLDILNYEMLFFNDCFKLLDTARIALPKLTVACSESESWPNFTDSGSYSASDQTECGSRERLRQVSLPGPPSEGVQRRLRGDGLCGNKEGLRSAHALSVLPGLPGIKTALCIVTCLLTFTFRSIRSS